MMVPSSLANSRQEIPGNAVNAEAKSGRIREHGNPSTLGHPDDLKRCDLTAMGEKLRGVMYATDEWAGPDWDENVPPRDNSCLSGQQKTAGNGGGKRHPSKSIREYNHSLNTLCMSS